MDTVKSEERAAGRVYMMASQSRSEPWICSMCKRRRDGQCVTARVDGPSLPTAELSLCGTCAEKMRAHLRRVCPSWTLALVLG